MALSIPIRVKPRLIKFGDFSPVFFAKHGKYALVVSILSKRFIVRVRADRIIEHVILTTTFIPLVDQFDGVWTFSKDINPSYKLTGFHNIRRLGIKAPKCIHFRPCFF